jgi:bifunctional NMN adenylyltransferase/nudix hydrolase
MKWQEKEFQMPGIKYDYGVFIGRFAPIHDGHVKVMMEALAKCDYLIVVCGSDNLARNTRTPFTALERQEMIRIATNHDERILLTSVGDYPYNDNLWLAEVQHAVNSAIRNHEPVAKYTNRGFKDYTHSIALAGMSKDETSFYLKLFPQYESIAVSPADYEGEVLSATAVREYLFAGNIATAPHLDPRVKTAIGNHIKVKPEIWEGLRSDWEYEKGYEAAWGRGPHTTVDSAVIQAGHILLIKRGNDYGRDLWAMPGGFVNRERLIHAAVRELREETRLKVPEKVLFGSLQASKVYDNPFRSNRSHIISHCFKFVLENVKAGLPEVKGSDDAKHAQWIPISMLPTMRGQFFEDHEQIINDIINA